MTPLPKPCRYACAVSLVLCACSSRGGEPPIDESPDPLAQAAQESFLRSGNAQSNAERVAAGRAALLEKARVQPDTLSLVNVLLTRGMEAKTLAPVLDGADASLMTVEAKTPVGDGGKVMTLWITQRELTQFGGTTQEQLEKALGRQRLFFLQQAGLREDPQGAQEYRDIAYSQALLFYRVEVVGRAGALARLTGEPAVNAVFLTEDQTHLDGYLAQRSAFEAMMHSARVVKGRPASEGPPPDSSPVK